MAAARAPREAPDTAAAPVSVPVPVEDVMPTKRLFTVHEYHKMGEAGILTEDDRVELIEGEILVMPPIGEGHFGNVNQLSDVFYGAFRGRAVIHVQNPVRLGLRIEPEPDIALLRYRADFYKGKFPEPEDILLLVEVAESSIGYDRRTKEPLYARAVVPEYWIVDVIHREIIVHRDPNDARYRSIQTLKAGDTIAPLAFPDVSLAVSDLLG